MKLLPEILRTREPGKIAYTFLNEEGEETASLTYGELHARAASVAAELSRTCEPGDRALLVFPQCPEFIIAYFGCLYAQLIAVPVNPPRRTGIQDATRAIVQDCEPAAVLTVSSMAGLKSTVEQLVGSPQWIAVDEVPEAGFEPLPVTGETLAFLQYTSGSTSAPKGVMVSHGNLVANQEMIRHGFGHDEHSTVVGWAPFFHDQGLIGNVLQPLYVGATAILLSPMAFIRRPLLWLETISRYRAHTSGGPNFAFDACVAAARGGVPDIELNAWRVAFNGAEPILPATLDRFARTFGPHGFDEKALYPCYGLAEATLIVTGSRKDRGPRTAEVDADELAQGRFVESPGGRILAGSGTVLPGEELRIVHPETRKPCAAGEIGEIVVRGGHVARGYWKKPDAEAFAGGYLHTGDLGVLADDELYVVGRLKDLMIIRGRNHYPQDLEHTAQHAHPAARPGGSAAFTEGGKPVLVQEIRREHRLDADELEVTGAIRAAVLAEHGISLGDVVLVRAGQLGKTSSGKIMRAAARKRYLDGGFARHRKD
ncbi:fatty acyl-AMP ligase [Amycolatopsis acidicola]|uniref:Fatty acyl-AMP ligase n=1 Tax=Amycolatopsis acidicola TaxID=2596893 RepID=A0A5N0V092_9PSEU|nr:fatty acyl-AMP ligase [Amycolatopsis acidicola]KAA9159632.1 fatty acyl-AMP ligase [Amycolatopsis acidicola]